MRVILLILVMLLPFAATAQDSVSVDIRNKKRLKAVVATGAVGYTVSLAGLSSLWYSNYERQPFQFFNDNDGWLYMDKFGHTVSSYYIGRVAIEALSWAGVERKKAVWYGGSLGFIFLSSVEYLDGISEGWGASPGDIAANTTGTALLIGQELLWREQRITLKWSYSNSPYAIYQPEKLGSGFTDRWLKDYNGQTYWLSANPASFIRETRLPEWLNIAVGYGANGMLAAVENPLTNKVGELLPQFRRYRQWYLSPDIDLTRLKPKSRFLKAVLKVGGFIKVPMPTIEFNNVDKVKLHWLFF